MSIPLPKVFDVPLFPLPETILFPGMLLPLHIFEPRYRLLLEEAMRGEKLIAMGHLRPGWENGYYQTPPVYEIVGVGRIAWHQKNEDQTSNIALIGLVRGRIQSESQSDPFRIATVQQIKEREITDDEELERCMALREDLVQAAQALMRRSLKPDAIKVLEQAFQERKRLGQITDFLASVFAKAAKFRQTLLEITDVLQRATLLRVSLESAAADFDPSPPPFTGSLGDYSLN